MKYKPLLLSLLLSGGLCHAQLQKTEIKDFKMAGPYRLSAPISVDSTNATQGKFQEKMLLDAPLSLSALKQGTDWTGDVLPSFSDAYATGMLSFALQGSDYMKAKLQVKGPKQYKVYVDGKEQNGTQLALEPLSHEVVIRYLTAPGAKDSISVSLEHDGKATLQPIAADGRRYSLYDCMDGKRVTGVSLSPSGKYAVVRYRLVEHGGKSRSYAQIKELATGRILAEKSGYVQWMPSSDRYLQIESIGEKRRLYAVEAATSVQQLLCEDLPSGSITVSPKEDYLILSERIDGPKERKDVYQILEPDDRQPGWRGRVALSKLDLQSGLCQRLTFGHRSVYLNDISADGSHLLLTVSRSRLTQRPFDLTSVYELDLNSMKVDTLLRDQGFVQRFQYAPDGRSFLVSATGEAFGGQGLKIAKGQTSSMADGQLFIYDRASGSVKAVTKDFNPAVTSALWSKGDGQIYFMAEDRDYVRLYTLNPKTGAIHSLGAKEDVVTGFDVAEKSPFLMYLGQSASNSFRLYSLDLKSKKSTCVEDDSKVILDGIRLGDCKEWNFVSSRGDTIYGRFYLPPHFDPAQKYPMIVNYYGGCSPTGRTMESRYPAHAYAAQGYIVYVVQPSGATGFGQEFSARHVNAWGKMTADDIIEGTKKFCDEHAFVNRKKIGCIGASYGGFMTQYLQTVTDIFAAAISHAGISDITSYWGEGYWGYSYSELASANHYPWNDRDMYTKQSPLFNADKIHTPLLFLHGSVDTNVPIGESIQMFTALKLLGRETAFVVVDDQDHHILDYDKRVRWQNTIFAWFAKWLKGEDSWWNTLYTPKDL